MSINRNIKAGCPASDDNNIPFFIRVLPDIKIIIDIPRLTTIAIEYILSLISAGILLVVFWLGNKLIQKTLDATLTRMKIERQAINLLIRGARAGLYIFNSNHC